MFELGVTRQSHKSCKFLHTTLVVVTPFWRKLGSGARRFRADPGCLSQTGYI